MIRNLTQVVMMTSLLSLAACSSDGIELSKATADFDWPFSVDSGTVECRNDSEVVFVVGSITYSINGTADARADLRGYRDIRPIWIDNPEIESTKISIGPIINIGLEQC